MRWKYILSASFILTQALVAPVQAQEAVPVEVPDEIVATGLMKHVMPRFALKTGVRLSLVEGEGAVVIGSDGTPLMEGLGRIWSVRHQETPRATRFAEWLLSDVGQRTIASYAPEGEALFGPAPEQVETVEQMDFDGDPTLGLEISELHCKRCHAVAPGEIYSNIGSTPSFFVLRTLSDWPDRFAAFYVLNPHPAFTQVVSVTPPFPEDRPPTIAPIEMTLEEVDAVLAYVAGLDKADLGEALVHQ